jgi:Aspartyl protease
MLFQADRITPFSSGSVACRYGSISQASSDIRIIVPVDFGGIRTEAVIDTGAPYAIVHPEIAQSIGLLPHTSEQGQTINIRGLKFKGHLYRIVMILIADNGFNLKQEVLAFAPDPEESGWGDLPSFLGIQCCLEFIRFAFDLTNQENTTFYFGSNQ